jgi:hypothetical protein
VERTAEAVAARSVAPAPLMAARWGRPFPGEERAGTAWAASVGCLEHWREWEEARGDERAPGQSGRRGHGGRGAAGGR